VDERQLFSEGHISHFEKLGYNGIDIVTLDDSVCNISQNSLFWLYARIHGFIQKKKGD